MIEDLEPSWQMPSPGISSTNSTTATASLGLTAVGGVTKSENVVRKKSPGAGMP